MLLVGTKLQHVVSLLALEIVEPRGPSVGGTQVKPRDELFWFGKPEILLRLIQFISFQVNFSFLLLITDNKSSQGLIKKNSLMLIILKSKGNLFASQKSTVNPVYIHNLVSTCYDSYIVHLQNAFEMATFIWSLVSKTPSFIKIIYNFVHAIHSFYETAAQWGFKQRSCFMKNHAMIVIRLTCGYVI